MMHDASPGVPMYLNHESYCPPSATDNIQAGALQALLLFIACSGNVGCRASALRTYGVPLRSSLRAQAVVEKETFPGARDTIHPPSRSLRIPLLTIKSPL